MNEGVSETVEIAMNVRPQLWSAAGIFISGAAVGGGLGTYWATKKSQEISIFGSDLERNERVHKASLYGNPVSSYVREFENFVVEWDPRLRVPRWVLETFNADSLRGEGTRESSKFAEDNLVRQRFRSSLDDYRGSGYDRGHMAPAANHKSSQKAMDDTFVLANIAPQVGAGFNRDYWARFEKFVQNLAFNKYNDVFVVTGPLFLPQPISNSWTMQHPMLGKPPRLIGVPSHFYKVVLGVPKNRDSKLVLGAFVMPNAPIEPETPLAAFSVPLSALEAAAGIEFFPQIPVTDQHKEEFDSLSLLWQKYGEQNSSKYKLIEGGYSSLSLLPSVSGDRTGSTSKSAKPGAPVPGKGKIQHICEDTLCKLPPEKWWETSKKFHRKSRNKN